MIKWFAANQLVINLDKTNIIKFITNDLSHSALNTGYKEKYVEETANKNFSVYKSITTYTGRTVLNK
jgi:hypothetical protein